MTIRTCSLRIACALALVAPGAPLAGQGARGTIKICRNVAIPDGYTVVAEATSPNCPSGAYLIKREAAPAAAPAQPARRAVGLPPAASAQQTHRRPRRTEAPRASQPEPLPDATPEPEETVRRPPVLTGAVRDPDTAAGAEGERAAASRANTPQEVDEGEVLRVDTNLVTVPVSVVDREGRNVAGLKKEDFHVFENGVEQQIAFFDQTEKPFTVALLLDTSDSTSFRLEDIKRAAIDFAKQLRRDDQVLVVAFSDQVVVLTEATSARATITGVIDVFAESGSKTRLYDALDLVISNRLSRVRGRKAIVLFTDGVDTASRLATYDSTVHLAEELDALIYPVQYDTAGDMQAQYGSGGGTDDGLVVLGGGRDAGWKLPGAGSQGAQGTRVALPAGASSPGAPYAGLTADDYKEANEYLHALADKTGGRLFRADDPQQLSRAFAQVAEELRRQYSLGYYPKNGGGARRQIKVKLDKPGLVAKARESYVAKGQER
jgi:VWFA-related protein